NGITATDRQGNLVPFQFLPEPAFDPEENITGLIVTRLIPNRVNYLKLEFGAESEEQPARSYSVKTPHCVVVHEPTKGGLPTKITFRATGKVFDDFRWQERVHHEKLGGFTLQNDKIASVERIARGPLCTAMRIRTRYVDSGGKSPASNPEAIYHWIYFNELPLVFVTAEMRQTEAFTWNELHFLELNFPGEDFKGWAGGEPLNEGIFQATGKSHHTANWGALVDGTDVIAMFGCDRLIFHDGRGGYGTYLHAHGDRAWKPWSDTRAQFSAWFWIGSSNDAIENVQALVNQSPAAANIIVTTADVRTAVEAAEEQPDQKWRSAMAQQLEAAGRLGQAVDVAQGRLLPNWILAEAGDLKLVLERTEQGIRTLSLLDTTTGRELLAPETLPLFSAVLRDTKTKELLTVTADSGWGQVDVFEGDATAGDKLTFRTPIDARLRGIRAEVKLHSDETNSAFKWDLEVVNDNRQWGLWRVVFPQVSVKHLGEEAKIFLPHTAGIELSDMWNSAQRKGGTYPSGWTCMQYMAAYNTADRTGLYIGMQDPFGSTKDIFAEGQPDQHAVAFRFEHPVPDMGKPGVGFDLPGEAKWQLLRGDWFDAAIVYRTWVSREAKWWPTLGPDGRSDTPEWMRQLPAWAMTGGPASGCVPQLKTFAKELGKPVGFHWYNWHQIPFDNDYPHYFPPKDGFASGVVELKKAGVYVMPYINGRLWDTHDKGAEDWRFTRVALAAATKDEGGNPYTESYGSKETDGNNVTLAAMCPSTSLWQGRVRDIVLRLFDEYGLNGVYVDQIAAARPRLCFDASHGHPLGGGHWWTQGYWEMLDTIRAAKPANCMLTTECNAEPYIKWFDGYLTWHWQEQNMVPAFSAVYGGAIQMFGRAYRGGRSQDLAHRMKAGQQLVFGEQIGWFNPNIINRSDCGKFLRDCIQLRWRLKEYFYAGRMARPVKLLGSIPTVTADWQWRGEWPITTSAIMTGTWRLENKNKIVLLFVNVSDHSLITHFELNPGEYNLSGKLLQVVSITPDGHQSKFTIQATDKPQVKFAPRSVFAWEISPASGN
ncbi:MAG: DUF6259 domain-containing protein, partial [Phycisphaerales bacterium]